MMHEEHSVVNLKDPKQKLEAPAPIPARPVVPPKPKFEYSKKLVISLALLLLIPLGIGLYLKPPLSLGGRAVEEGESSDEAGQEQVPDIVVKVGALIDLPQGEIPTVATVTDPEKLKDQVFFANAQRGDQVLIYTQARKAYLFDPIRGKLREVAPITTQ